MSLVARRTSRVVRRRSPTCDTRRATGDKRAPEEDLMARPTRQLGSVATRLLFENDRVRVWELDLAPGERSAVHEHTLDYLLVQIDGDRIAAIPEPDTRGPYKDYIEADVVPGRVRFVARGGIETAVNIGRQRYREVLIELT
jgi:hypothetical protein